MNISELADKTVWVVACPTGGFEAIDSMGNAIAYGKFKSYLDHRAIAEMSGRKDILAVAHVVLPTKRQPKRKLPQRKRRW